MGVGRRAYDLLRGYVNREWERIQGVERDYAEQELRDVTIGSSARPADAGPTTPEAARHEATGDTRAHARQVLGVGPEASYADIRREFERLNKRSDPTKFPVGSAEATQAADIQRRVQWAYGVLSEDVDPTERRFRSLEIQ